MPVSDDERFQGSGFVLYFCYRRNLELEATVVEKYAAIEAVLDERGRRVRAGTGYGGDALVSDATGLSCSTIQAGGRREIEFGEVELGRIRHPGAGRPNIEQSPPGIKQALEKLVDPQIVAIRSRGYGGRARVGRSSRQRCRRRIGW